MGSAFGKITTETPTHITLAQLTPSVCIRKYAPHVRIQVLLVYCSTCTFDDKKLDISPVLTLTR